MNKKNAHDTTLFSSKLISLAVRKAIVSSPEVAHRHVMQGRSPTQALAILTLFVMVVSWAPFSAHHEQLEDSNERMEQIGGGQTIEQQCSSITFEDIFEYTSAIFHISIANDWETASVTATAWVNHSTADDIREKLDSYLDGLYHSGGDGWISTDEREAVRAVASECIEHALTRIGMREGEAHRGGVGIDWKNTTWQSDGVEIEEWNLIPPDHAEKRDCESWGSGNDCYEIPVRPNTDRDCDTQTAASQNVDECRLELWMNATLIIPGVEIGEEFTIVVNGTNVTAANFEFTFPETEDLRLDLWEECEGRDVSTDAENPPPTPQRGTCIGDQSSSYTISGADSNETGPLIYTVSPVRSPSQWPSGEDIFADFTTAPIPVDNPPQWTDEAPEHDAWFPSPSGGERMWASWQSVSTWFSDEGATSALDINCRGDASLEVRQSADNSFWAEIPRGGTGDVMCSATDSAGQTSGERTWHLGVPFSVSTDSLSLSSPHHTILVTPTSGWPELDVEVGLSQSGGISPTSSLTVSEVTEFDVASGSIVPGSVQVWVRATGEGVYSMEHVYELGIIKESSPPLISISEYGFDGSYWMAQGQFSDPDGENVAFTMQIMGSAAGTVVVSGNSWATPSIDFELWNAGEYDVEIIGCDESGKCSEVSLLVNNTHLHEITVITPEPPEKVTQKLPLFSAPMTILALTIGLIYSGRRD